MWNRYLAKSLPGPYKKVALAALEAKPRRSTLYPTPQTIKIVRHRKIVVTVETSESEYETDADSSDEEEVVVKKEERKKYPLEKHVDFPRCVKDAEERKSTTQKQQPKSAMKDDCQKAQVGTIKFHKNDDGEENPDLPSFVLHLNANQDRSGQQQGGDQHASNQNSNKASQKQENRADLPQNNGRQPGKQNQGKGSNNQSNSSGQNSNQSRDSIYDRGIKKFSLDDIQRIKGNLYHYHSFPGMGRTLQPSRATVMLREDVIECQSDPRPNAFVDMNTGVVRVYHGPVYGNPYASIVPTQQMSVGSFPTQAIPPFFAGPQATQAMNMNRMYGGPPLMPGTEQRWGPPPHNSPAQSNNNLRGQSQNGFQGQNRSNSPGQNQNNSSSQNRNNSPNLNQNNSQGQNWNNSPNLNQNNSQGQNWNNSPAQNKNSPAQSNSGKTRTSPPKQNNMDPPPNDSWIEVTSEQADRMAKGEMPGDWGNDNNTGGGGWDNSNSNNAGWGGDNNGQMNVQSSGNGNNNDSNVGEQSWDNANTGGSGWDNGNGQSSSPNIPGNFDSSKPTNNAGWGGDTKNKQSSNNNSQGWGENSGNNQPTSGGSGWNNQSSNNTSGGGGDDWGAPTKPAEWGDMSATLHTYDTENQKPEGGNSGGAGGWNSTNNGGGSGWNPGNNGGGSGWNSGGGGNSSSHKNWATETGISAGSWGEGGSKANPTSYGVKRNTNGW
ncbi:hypothetical protein EG329_010002 [Mollisiaceae sp. DMI_Dod_QoI]|nr:hypothetical protein EG329_010002 [Helotiales sp. DMI_Dod_QoI]